MSQYINLPMLYLNGMNVSWASNTTLTVASGQCRDSTNNFDIQLTNSTTLNGSVNGLNGLDQGSLSASTMYYVFVVYNSSLQSPISGTLLSLSATAPLMPSAFGYFRRIGTVQTDGSTHFLKFSRSLTNTNVVFHQWDSPISVLSSGSATTFTAQALNTAVPAQSGRVFMTAIYTPANVANTANIRQSGSSAAAGSCPIVLKSNVTSVSFNQSVSILPQLASGNQTIEYEVTSSDTLSLNVVGFEDLL